MCLIRNCQCLPRDSDYSTQSKQPGKVKHQEEEEKDEEGEYEVERIVAKGRAEYQVGCTEVLDAYESNLKIGRKTYPDEKKAEPVQTTTNDHGDLYFLLKWRGGQEMDLIPAKAKEANVKIPRVVISSESESQIEIGKEHSKNNVSEEQKINSQMKRLREMLKKQTKKRKIKKN